MNRMWWTLGLVGLACKPAVKDRPEPGDAQRYAAALCGAVEACGCAGEGSQPEACERESVQQFRWLEELSPDDVSFDGDCFEEMVSYLRDEVASEKCVSSRTWKGPSCQVFEGELDLGSRCELDAFDFYTGLLTLGGSDCQPSLTCRGGVCRGLRSQVHDGGEPCTLDGDVCLSGYFCSPAGVCEPSVPEAGRCIAPRSCERDDLYCEGLGASGGEGVCAMTVPPGGDCSPGEIDACGLASGRYCSEGQCRDDWPLVCELVDFREVGFWAPDWIPRG